MSCQNTLNHDGKTYQCQNKTADKYCQQCLNNIFQYRCEKTVTQGDHTFRCTNITVNKSKICDRCKSL